MFLKFKNGLFRENTWQIWFLVKVAAKNGIEFLNNTVAQVIDIVNLHPSSFEMNPQLVKHPFYLETNKTNTIKICDMLIDLVLKNIDSLNP